MNEQPPPDQVLLAKDPGLFFYLFFDRERPEHGQPDHREVFAAAFDALATELRLKRPLLPPMNPEWATHVEEQQLDRLSSSGPQFKVWVGAAEDDEERHCELIGYTYRDALVLHAGFVQKGADVDAWQAWDEFRRSLDTALAHCDLERSSGGLWGRTAVFWGIFSEEAASSAHASGELHGLVDEGCQPQAREVSSRIGRLCLVSSNHGSESRGELYRDSWVLLSTDAQEVEAGRSLHVYEEGPGEFPLLALAHHKFHFQYREYSTLREYLYKIMFALDQRAEWLLRAQQDYAGRLHVVGSRELREVQRKQSGLLDHHAEFKKHVTRVETVRNTLDVNLSNYQHLVDTLASAHRDDSLFAHELDQMKRWCQQVDYDAAYFRLQAERAKATVDAAQMRLEISQARQASEDVKLHGLEVSGVIASLAVLIVVEIMQAADFIGAHPILAASIMLLTLAATFGATESILHWGKVKTDFDKYAAGSAAGFGLTTLLAWFLERFTQLEGPGAALYFPIAIPVFGAGLYVGTSLFSYCETAWRRRQEQRQTLLGEYSETLAALRTARQEVDELLDIEPSPAPFWIEHRCVLGLRFVVPPWEFAPVVRRILSIVPGSIRYESCGPGKTAHVDLDLKAKGVERTITLGRVDVATPLQDLHRRSTGWRAPIRWLGMLWASALVWLERLVFGKQMTGSL